MNYRCNQTTAVKHLHTAVAVRSVDWIFIVGAPAWRSLDEYVTLGRKFYNLLLKQETVAAHISCHILFLEKAFIVNKTIIQGDQKVSVHLL